MRGPFDDQGELFSYISPEQRVPTQHPLRTIRELVREVFRDLDHDFRTRYSTTGRPSIPPEQLLSALLRHIPAARFGADKAYDVAEHVARLRAKNITPHIAVNAYIPKTGQARTTSIDGRTTRHKGYSLSQGKRKMIECMFGWGKQHGTMRKTKYRGLAGVAAGFLLNLIGYTLIRIPKLLAQRG